jgi:hypothetical protein
MPLPRGRGISFRRNMFNRNNKARIEKNQEKLDAGFVSTHFPGVAGIVISMMYKQKGVANPIQRIVNFFPGSYAFFRLDCLSDDCVDGGFDMSRIITSMIRNHREGAEGELGCDDTGPRTDHSNIAYEVAIQYT